ncbi:MAG: flavodoxin-dependent (E)-4-hydroxy-3-methylbut-2-enyl-diphosphate synthase [Spirochaetota bacterium]
MVNNRRQSRQVRAGSLVIGGGAPVSLQSMTSCPLEDIAATITQIRSLEEAGAQMVRLAIRTEDHVTHLREIRQNISLPLCGDIHFNHRIALGAIDAGIDKIRLNPGNVGERWKVEEVVRSAKEHNVPIRIGVNGGSLDSKKYPQVTPRSLTDSAMDHVKILEDLYFDDIVISIKSSNIPQTLQANRLLADTVDYPIHVGLTEAGYGLNCIVQSSVAIGSLLLEGIGDTIRVSMTGDPVEEITVGRKILEATGSRKAPIQVISCPTCGRTDPGINLLELAKKTDQVLTNRFHDKIKASGNTVTVAVMGCEVNGPGEAAHADIGIAGGRGGQMLLFAGGKKLRKVDVNNAVQELADELEVLLEKLL